MESTGHRPLLTEGFGALDEARWADAKAAFQQSLAEQITPDALDGLARSLWWIGDTAAAVTARTRAYTYFKRESRVDEASRAAVWLALEYSTTPGREALARGWLARAERLADDPGSVAAGWLALTRSTLEVDPLRMASHAEEALAVARDHDDASLEIRALARAGLALVLSGRTEEGMSRLDEAMTAAAAGESEHPEIFAETCCDMVSACEATLDMRRLEQWGQVAERFLDMRPHPDLLGFCGCCCASVLAARGDLTGAEQWLTWTINSLEGAGHESRCVDPRAKLAELRLGQGRVEEARRLLAGIEARPESTRVMVALYVMSGELGAASSLLHRRLAKIGDASTAAIPILAMLVPIQIERGDLAGAGRSAERIDELANQSGQAQQRAEADVARGRFALAKGATLDASQALFSAVEAYDHLGMPIHAARTRLYLAETLADSDPETAIAEARAASSRLDEAGITADADRADSLIRSLGGRGRVGPKQAGLLTRREHEVLSLIAEGLTNAEIAERLFISVKTAGNHVSHVLTKLNLRSRTEAAAFAHQNRSGVVLSPL